MYQEERAPLGVLGALNHVPNKPANSNRYHVCVHEVVMLVPVALQRAAAIQKSVHSYTCSINSI